jgi:dTMP kinase
VSSHGRFLVFEGGDGVGKTTQVDLLCVRLAEAGQEVVRTFEPGDSAVGAQIRRLVLDPSTGDLDARAEALLYAADKAQHLHAVVRPALRRGAVVVCDRYVDSMLAYQGAGRVLELAEVEQVARWATDHLRPDLTVLLDVDPRQAVHAKQDKDRLEAAGETFHDLARQHFLALAAREPRAYLVLDARRTREEIAAEVWSRVAPLLPAPAGRPALSEPSGRLSS